MGKIFNIALATFAGTGQVTLVEVIIRIFNSYVGRFCSDTTLVL